MELVKVENNEIIVAQETIEQMRKLNEYKVQFDILTEKVRDALKKAMSENGVKKIENEVFTAVYKAPTQRQTVDTTRLKEEGLYDEYSKFVPVKDSVTVTFK